MRGLLAATVTLTVALSADDVTTAMGELERRVRDAKTQGESTAFFFYCSGHAQDGSLRLSKTKLALEAVARAARRGWFNRAPSRG